MKWKSVERKLRNDASQEEFPINVDEIWSAIEPAVDQLNGEKKRKKRFFFLLIFGLMVMTAGGFGIGKYSNSHPQEMGSQSISINEENQDVSLTEKRNAATNQDVHSSKFINLRESPESLAEDDIELPKASQSLSSTSEEIVSHAHISLSSSARVGQDARQNRDLPTLVSLSKSVQENSNTMGDGDNVENQKIEKLGGLKLNTENQEDLGSADVSSEKEKTQKKTYVTSSQLSIPPFSVRSMHLNNLEGMLNRELSVTGGGNKKGDAVQKHDVLTFSIAPSFGVSYAFKKLDARDGLSSTLLHNRTNFETSLEVLHYGVEVSAKHRSNIGLSVGIEQTNINELYNYQNLHVDQEWVDGIVVRRINFEGDTIDIAGQVLQTETTSINKRIYNTYSLVSIPFSASYSFPVKKWNIGVNAGIRANLSLKTKGVIPTENFEDHNLSTDQDQIFKSKVGLVYHVGGRISRRIARRFDLSLSPRAIFYPSEFTVSSYELAQKYWLVGGTVGLHYRFSEN